MCLTLYIANHSCKLTHATRWVTFSNRSYILNSWSDHDLWESDQWWVEIFRGPDYCYILYIILITIVILSDFKRLWEFLSDLKEFQKISNGFKGFQQISPDISRDLKDFKEFKNILLFLTYFKIFKHFWICWNSLKTR